MCPNGCSPAPERPCQTPASMRSASVSSVPVMPKVVVVSGHLTDEPGRPAPRFPEAAVPRVADEICRQLDAFGFGAHDVLICGGARGADLLAAEEALRRGASVRLCLAVDRDEFVETSVRMKGTDWVQRFETVASKSDVRAQPVPPDGQNVYEAANRWMIRQAEASQATDRRALIVWDGRDSNRRGGTADFAKRAADAGIHLVRIDPGGVA
ncbi:MAG: hypothetical protein JWN99_2444 [Ilumatobacteraceae bacterium]|nr:hypothetical protein [Ilumatobacteraceae bacterium]